MFGSFFTKLFWKPKKSKSPEVEDKPVLPESDPVEEPFEPGFGEGSGSEPDTEERPISDEDQAAREGQLMADTTAEFNAGKSYDAVGVIPGSSLVFTVFGVSSAILRQNETFGGRWNDTIRDDGRDSKIYGLSGNDKIYGNGGDDFLFGQRGNDRLFGGEGKDVLDGGKGYDVLHGGGGVDIFVFRKNEGTTDIADFELGLDVLDLEGFDGLTFERLKEAGEQYGDDIYFKIGYDTLIIRDADLLTLEEPDLCAK